MKSELKEEADYCRDHFTVLVKKGDEIMVDTAISTICTPTYRGQKTISTLLSSTEETIPPRYVTTRSLKIEGTMVLDISGGMHLDGSQKKKKCVFRGIFFAGESRGCELLRLNRSTFQ